MSFLGSFGTFLSLLFVAVAVFFALPPRKVDLVNLDKCVSRRGYYGVEDLQVIPGQPVVLGTSDTKEYHFVQGWISELTDNPRGVRRNHGVAATRGHIVAFNVKDLISQDKYLADVGVIMPGVNYGASGYNIELVDYPHRDFHPHGMFFHPKKKKKSSKKESSTSDLLGTVFIVNHLRNAESVDVFQLRGSFNDLKNLRLHWTESVQDAALFTGINDVVAVNNKSFFVTNWLSRPCSNRRCVPYDLSAMVSGERTVTRCRKKKGESFKCKIALKTADLPGGPNGIALSHDKTRLYARDGHYGVREFTHNKKTGKLVFNRWVSKRITDNINVAPDGSLLLAGTEHTVAASVYFADAPRSAHLHRKLHVAAGTDKTSSLPGQGLKVLKGNSTMYGRFLSTWVGFLGSLVWSGGRSCLATLSGFASPHLDGLNYLQVSAKAQKFLDERHVLMKVPSHVVRVFVNSKDLASDIPREEVMFHGDGSLISMASSADIYVDPVTGEETMLAGAVYDDGLLVCSM